MSLATRCPSCGTVFRVVQDQLRISEGWVRCGRCNGVFDATEVLFDIDLGTPVRLDLAPQPLPDPVRAHSSGDAAAAGAFDAHPAPAGPPAPVADEPEAPLLITDWEAGPLPGHASSAGSAPHSSGGHDFDPALPLLRTPSIAEHDAPPDTQPATHPDTHPSPQAATQAATQPATWAATAGAALAAEPAPADMSTPAFLRAADRAARWRRPAVRAGLVAAVAVLGISGVLQAALLERDLLAAWLPVSAPALRGLCGLLGCTVQAPRRIDALTLESTQLGRLDTPGQYRLHLALRNKSDLPVLAPALELTLTDGQGKLVLRRVLQVQDLGWAAPAVPAGQAVTLQAILSAGAQRIDGYTVELFYP